jgi:sRNA-binding protein
MQKINFNKSIKDKEKKILEYYKKKSGYDKAIPEKPTIKKRTKKNIPKPPQTDTTKQSDHDTTKLTKTANLLSSNDKKITLPESNKQKIVQMD